MLKELLSAGTTELVSEKEPQKPSHFLYIRNKIEQKNKKTMALQNLTKPYIFLYIMK